MSVTVAIENPNQPDVLDLIDASDVYMNALYPPEGNFAVDVDALSQPDIAFVVARLNGKAAGCGAIKWFEDGTAELKRIYVSSDARGNGIGRRIMEQLQELADAKRVERLYLETGPLNIEAVQMYRAFGFEECGPFADYQENPYSLFMTKHLDKAPVKSRPPVSAVPGNPGNGIVNKSVSLNTLYGFRDERRDDDSPLVQRVNAVLRKPLLELDEEDVRLLISQQDCLDHVIPLALDRLEIDPLADVSLYPGDLLDVCLTVDRTFWTTHPELRSRLEEIAMRLIVDHRAQLNEVNVGNIPNEIKNFLNSYAS